MSTVRELVRVQRSVPTVEGAGVRLRRAFGQADPHLDPFLLLDDFHSDDPADFIAGFPWHPHRGIETITYVLHGEVAHGDSMGNRGVIRAGDVQWMTAGSGIIHEEMPQPGDGRLRGLQLWANLPASHKMMPPRYRELAREQIPVVELPRGGRVTVICGEVAGVQGPVREIVTDPLLLDVALEAGQALDHPLAQEHNALAYVLEGEGSFGTAGSGQTVSGACLVVLGEGDQVRAQAADRGLRFLLLAGRPLGEPVAWGGPIVMNTKEELQQAFAEYRQGTFIRQPV